MPDLTKKALISVLHFSLKYGLHIYAIILLLATFFSSFIYLQNVIRPLMIDRSAYCDAQLPLENLKIFLPRLIPVCYDSQLTLAYCVL